MSVARFWRKIPQRYNLIGTKCTSCGRNFYPPRTFCPDCRREGHILEHAFSGSGTVVTWTVIHNGNDQYDYLAPYPLAIVQLDEGPRLTAPLACDPGEVSIGMRVKSVFRRMGTDGESGPIHYGTKFAPESL